MSANVLFPQAMEIEGADGSKITLSMKEATLRNLFDVRRSYTMVPTPEGQNLVGGGKIRYRIPLLTKSVDFDYTHNGADVSNNNTVAQSPLIEEKEVSVSKYRIQRVRLNNFDFSMLVNGGTLQSQILANMQESIICDKNKYFFDGLVAYFDANPLKTIYFKQLSEAGLQSTDTLKSIQKMHQWTVAEMARTINNKYVGVKPSEFFAIVDSFASINVNMLLTGLNASDKAFIAIQLGMFGITGPVNGQDFMLGGILNVVDNFLEQDIPANFSFNDARMDYSKYNGFILHRESIGLPFGIESSYAWINQNNAQPEYLTLYCMGFGVLRPELVKAYVKDIRVIESPKIKVGDVIDIKDISNIDSRFMTVSLTSSATGKATVSGSKITGVEAGSTNITITVGDESKTFALTVEAAE